MQDELFLKQRRNLLLTSLALFFLNFAGIEIPEDLSILGSKFKVNEPVIIYMSIWALLFYFLWRYILVFNLLNSEEKDYGFNFFNFYRYGEREYIYFRRNDFIGILFNIIKIIFYIIRFLFSNAIGLIFVGFKSMFHINFSQTLLPIFFALFIMLISLFTPHFENEKPKMEEKIEKFTELTKSIVYDKPTYEINKYINSKKIEINKILGIKVFNIKLKKEKEDMDIFANY